MTNYTEITIPLLYPSLDLICWYLIIGGLFTATVFVRLLITCGEALKVRPAKELAIGIAVFMLGWPYICYLMMKESE